MEAENTGRYIHNHSNPTYPCKACAYSEGFKIGYDKALGQLAEMTEECKQMGRSEVVEWIDKTFANGLSIGKMKATNTWQAKLKEWGV